MYITTTNEERISQKIHPHSVESAHSMLRGDYMQTNTPQFWTDDMVSRFRDYCFPKYDGLSCPFDIFEKMFQMSIEDGQDRVQDPNRIIEITYSCNAFDRLLQSIPFYLQLSTEANYYKESNIGYLKIVNGQNVLREPQAKILACIRTNLELEFYLDKVISDANHPPGFGKVITLRLDDHYSERLTSANAVGEKLPIRELAIEYLQGQAKEKWSPR